MPRERRRAYCEMGKQLHRKMGRLKPSDTDHKPATQQLYIHVVAECTTCYTAYSQRSEDMQGHKKERGEG